MELSLIQAAKEADKSKSTIHRAIKSGKLSATRHADGSYGIDPAELFRVFPREPQEPRPVRQSGTQDGTPIPAATPMTSEAEVILRIKVEMLTQQLEREQETVTDLRKRLDRAEDRILALSAPVPASRPKGFWASIWGRREGS